MPLANRLEKQHRADVFSWHGVVSLFEMLKYTAEDFYKLSEQFTHFVHLPQLVNTEKGRVRFQECVDKLYEHCKSLKLHMSLNQLRRICELTNERASLERLRAAISELQTRIQEELQSKVCFCLSSDRVDYWHPFWLVGSPIESSFPSAWKEFQRAGKCYAYGEGTACAFHLQRALEIGLKSLAVKLGQRFDRNSWESHLRDIERELKTRYSAASPRTAEEKFYSEAATQFGHMKVAWRNPTMHIEAQYDDGEAKYLLDTIQKFMTHLAKNSLSEQP
ncbi:MAG TPA: hypothetical protein VK738_09455 [Terriglobales bacterium]|jgi:hypothetical protein|nr:hypothetical protein [Terriglobales bacterium]